VIAGPGDWVTHLTFVNVQLLAKFGLVTLSSIAIFKYIRPCFIENVMPKVSCVLICLMAGWLAIAAESPDRPKTAPSPVPPVLRDQDADPDDVVVFLPGAPVSKPEAAKPAPAASTKPGGLATPTETAPRNSTKVSYPRPSNKTARFSARR